ncbi:MAG TPA: hypothetical protein VNF49_09595 [Candidatus Binataceae bacterium]|nr:hypothetical protein [Candidatus Binataceae bacterium]
MLLVKPIAALLIGALLAACVQGCASTKAANELTFSTAPGSAAAAAPSETPARSGKRGAGAVGVWEGTTLVTNCPVSLPSRCNAQQRVSLTVLEGDNSKLAGYYKCAYGNMTCYNLNDSGKIIDGSLRGSRLTLRVMMPDGTSCVFTGSVAADAVVGGYSCYTGGSLLEQGSWRAKHLY